MALKNYQTALSLSKLYSCKVGHTSHGGDQLKPNLYINDGTIDFYASNSATQPTALSDMTLNTENSAVAAGIIFFSIIPNYFAIVQNTGTSTEINISGVDVNEIGSIS